MISTFNMKLWHLFKYNWWSSTKFSVYSAHPNSSWCFGTACPPTIHQTLYQDQPWQINHEKHHGLSPGISLSKKSENDFTSSCYVFNLNERRSMRWNVCSQSLTSIRIHSVTKHTVKWRSCCWYCNWYLINSNIEGASFVLQTNKKSLLFNVLGYALYPSL